MRLMLLILTYWKPSIVKAYIHYDMFILLVANMMPSYLQLYERNYVASLETAIIYLFLHFSFKPSIITLVISRIIFVLIQFLVYNESIGACFAVFFWSALQCTVMICLVHYALNFAGSLFIKQDIAQNELEQFLSTLDQGIIIVD